MNKKLLFIPLFCMLLAACDTSKETISIFLYSGNDTFISKLNNELQYKFSGEYNINNAYAYDSQSLQNEQLNEQLNNGTDLIIANIVDRLSASSFIEKAKKYNKPIIFCNREPLKEDVLKYKDVYYVGTDSSFEGASQATLVNECFGGSKNFKLSKYDKNKDGKIQLYMLKGEQGHQDTEMRSNTVLTSLSSLGYEVDLIQSQYCNWNREKAFLEFGKNYQYFSDEDGTSNIELLVANNDSMALGAIDYLLEKYPLQNNEIFMDKFFPIVGTNGEEDAIDYISRKYLYGTVSNNSKDQAKIIFEMSVKLLNHEPISNSDFNFVDDRFVYSKGEIINYDNYFKFL